jgi:uncharacterized coiled-coil protein SlyX
MTTHDVAQQVKVEQETLKHITGALKAAIEQGEREPSARLSRLRFIARVFQRHLDRLMSLEEQDGYLEDVVEASPHLSEEVAALRIEQDHLQDLLHRIVNRLERVSPTQQARVAVVSEEISALLERLEQHEHKEVELIQEAFLRDEGGEGG